MSMLVFAYAHTNFAISSFSWVQSTVHTTPLEYVCHPDDDDDDDDVADTDADEVSNTERQFREYKCVTQYVISGNNEDVNPVGLGHGYVGCIYRIKMIT